MVRGSFYIFRNGARWNVQHLGVSLDYTTLASAISDAVQAAQMTGAMGHAALVKIQGDDGRWETEWTYGLNLYPSK